MLICLHTVKWNWSPASHLCCGQDTGQTKGSQHAADFEYRVFVASSQSTPVAMLLKVYLARNKLFERQQGPWKLTELLCTAHGHVQDVIGQSVHLEATALRFLIVASKADVPLPNAKLMSSLQS